MSENFTLVTGRTIKQAAGLHKGKDSDAYHRSTALAEMNAEDMVRLGIADGQVVRLRTAAGQVEVPVHASALPPRMVFVPWDPWRIHSLDRRRRAQGCRASKGLLWR